MASAFQRPLKGSRKSKIYPVETLPDLSTLESAFQLQEYISLTIRYNIHHVSNIISIPSTRSSRTNTEGVNEAYWINEQLRYTVSNASVPSTRTYHFSDDLCRIFPIR
jgi:hypothetical protein